jgi:hypothetical protein
MKQASQSNATLGSQVRTMVQEFVRNATLLRHQKSCRGEDEQRKMIVPPLVLHFEDYLGNEQRQILDTMEGALNVHILAQFYGFGSMSYAELARGFVYADTHERWLSPIWYEPNKPNEMIREIHPQLVSSVVAMSWS